MPELLYAGFDTLEVSFQGALKSESLEVLRKAKDEASKTREDQLIEIGPGKVDGHVPAHGMTGGYAFVFDTGFMGEQWTFMDSEDTSRWNIAVKVRAANLAAHNYQEIKERIQQRLTDMGCIVLQESIRRADFAMDFLMPGDFELNQDQVVAHSHSKVSSHWGEKDTNEKQNHPSTVFRGRKLESITIGKMPGRQVIIYNKRKAAIEKQTPFWFKVWNIDPKDTSKHVWRVEFRAGKKELKDKYNLRSFKDFEDSIGDVFVNAAENIRYIEDQQTFSNISRTKSHPLWQAVKATLEHNLLEFRSGLLPGQISELQRDLTIECYRKLVTSNAIGLGVTLNLGDDEIRSNLPALVETTVAKAMAAESIALTNSIKRTRARLHFLADTCPKAN
ncbi:hypothetical protein [Thalassospira marina]|uniref:Uncharacterized protein n=1 Tax=Thalassospira marina TaxID=2048283 RepID=A0A2N3KYJ9_9PROT|nr:hypothetical protein [Thalassospira marina]PKR55603.1 hypothetical protein COO20_05440 [Thalassospira marina]